MYNLSKSARLFLPVGWSWNRLKYCLLFVKLSLYNHSNEILSMYFVGVLDINKYQIHIQQHLLNEWKLQQKKKPHILSISDIFTNPLTVFNERFR